MTRVIVTLFMNKRKNILARKVDIRERIQCGQMKTVRN